MNLLFEQLARRSWHAIKDKHKSYRTSGSRINLSLAEAQKNHEWIVLSSAVSTRRNYATALPPLDEQPKDELPSHIGRKSPKVDLRPRPLKATPGSVQISDNVDTSSPKNATQKNLKSVDVILGTSTDKGGGAQRSNPSNVLDTAKRDIENAMQHGIMRPPPEGAGRVRLLWHQLKELFVCML